MVACFSPVLGLWDQHSQLHRVGTDCCLGRWNGVGWAGTDTPCCGLWGSCSRPGGLAVGLGVPGCWARAETPPSCRSQVRPPGNVCTSSPSSPPQTSCASCPNTSAARRAWWTRTEPAPRACGHAHAASGRHGLGPLHLTRASCVTLALLCDPRPPLSPFQPWTHVRNLRQRDSADEPGVPGALPQGVLWTPLPCGRHPRRHGLLPRPCTLSLTRTPPTTKALVPASHQHQTLC